MLKIHDLARQNLHLLSEFKEVLDRIVSKSAFILRDEVREFETSVRNFLKEDVEVIGVNSGTDSLFLGLHGMGLRPGDEVIVPSRTYIASVSSIVHLKLVPRFVDVGHDLNIDINEIESHITESTKAIMPVHLSGHSCDMASITRIAREHNLKVIEDAAPTFGGKFQNRHVGTFGDYGAISLHPLKVFGVLGDGGLLITKANDSEYLRTFRDHGHPQPKNEEQFISFGVNSRLDNLQAGFANIKLRYVNSWIDRRREIAKHYSTKLLGTCVGSQVTNYLSNMNPSSNYFDTFSSYVLCVENPAKFSEFMLNGEFPVETSRDFPKPIHNHPNLQKFLPVSASRPLRNTEYFAPRTVKVPIYPELSDAEVDSVSEKLRLYFESI